jgi:hypothetical protein
MKIPRVGEVLFYADGQTDMTKLVVAFPNFAKAPKKYLNSKTTKQKQMDKGSIRCGVLLGQSIMCFKKSKSHEFIQHTHD